MKWQASAKYWYPIGWKCPHGVDFSQHRCFGCDQKIDWRYIYLTEKNQSDRTPDRRARELIMKAFDFIPIEQESLRHEILEFIAPSGRTCTDDLDWATERMDAMTARTSACEVGK